MCRKITLPEKLRFLNIDFKYENEYFWTKPWCILVSMIYFVIKVERQWKNHIKLRNCQIPTSHFSRLENLLKNWDDNFDHVWRAIIKFVLKYQMYLHSGSLPIKFCDVALSVSPQIWVYFQRVCTATPCTLIKINLFVIVKSTSFWKV